MRLQELGLEQFKMGIEALQNETFSSIKDLLYIFGLLNLPMEYIMVYCLAKSFKD